MAGAAPRRARVLKTDEYGVNVLAFSPDGATLAAGTMNGAIVLWDGADGPARAIYGHNGAVRAISFAPHERTLLSAGSDWTIGSNNPDTGARDTRVYFMSNSVRSVAFSPSGRIVAAAGSACTISTWDPSFGDLPLRRTPNRYSVVSANRDLLYEVGARCLAFSPDSSVLAVGLENGVIDTWDMTRWKWMRGFREHAGVVHSIAFSPDGAFLASGASDGHVRVRSANAHGDMRILRGHADVVDSVAYSPDGRFIASASRDSTVRLWDATTGACAHVLRGSLAPVHAFKPLYIRDYETGIRERVGFANDYEVRAVAFSPDGGLLAAGASNGDVVIWDTSPLMLASAPPRRQ